MTIFSTIVAVVPLERVEPVIMQVLIMVLLPEGGAGRDWNSESRPFMVAGVAQYRRVMRLKRKQRRRRAGERRRSLGEAPDAKYTLLKRSSPMKLRK